MSRILIYHNNDFDGTISASLMMWKYEYKETIGYNYQKRGFLYDSIKKLIMNADEIHVVDITLPNELMELTINKKLIVIDHHITEESRMRSYVARNPNMEYVFDNTISACASVYKYTTGIDCFLATTGKSSYETYRERLVSTVRYAAMYDVFDKTGTDEYTFDKVLNYQYGLRYLYKKPVDIIEALHYIPSPDIVMEHGKIALDVLTTFQESAISGDKTIDIAGERVLITNTFKFDTIYAERIGLDISLIITYKFSLTSGNVSFGMRATEDCKTNCGNVCKHFGGGGHEKAAGFSVPIESFNHVITEIQSVIMQNT